MWHFLSGWRVFSGEKYFCTPGLLLRGLRSHEIAFAFRRFRCVRAELPGIYWNLQESTPFSAESTGICLNPKESVWIVRKSNFFRENLRKYLTFDIYILECTKRGAIPHFFVHFCF